MGWVVNATPRPFYSRKRPGTHCIRGWVGPKAGLDEYGISRPPPGFDPYTVQPIASRYTDWAIPAHTCYIIPSVLHETFGVAYHGRQALFNAQSDQFICKTYHHAVPQLYILQKMLTSYPHGFSGPQIEIIPWESKDSRNTEHILTKICTDQQ